MIHDDAVSRTLQFFENLKILIVTNLTKITCGSMFDHLPCVVRKQADPACLVTFT